MQLHKLPLWMVALYGVFKGAAVAMLTFLIGTSFGQSMLVAFVSGSLGIIGMMGAAWITVRETRKTRTDVRAIKRKVGAERRAEDYESTPED